MNDEAKKEEIRKDIKELMIKHGMKHVGITAELGGNIHFGLLMPDPACDPMSNRIDLFSAIFNVGRLWQFARERARETLDVFEIPVSRWKNEDALRKSEEIHKTKPKKQRRAK